MSLARASLASNPTTHNPLNTTTLENEIHQKRSRVKREEITKGLVQMIPNLTSKGLLPTKM